MEIGSAQVNIKPVIDEEALDVITQRISEAVRDGVSQGMRDAERQRTISVSYGHTQPS